MADKKFSDFQNEAFDQTNTELVGFKQGDTTNNYRYDKTQLQTGILTGADNSILTNNAGYLATVDLQSDVGTTILPIGNGGTGNSSISDLQNISVNYASDGTGVLPADHGGTGVAGTNGQLIWNAVQQYAWLGTSTAYDNIPNATDIYLPFNSTALIDQSTNTAGSTKWVISTTSQGSGPSQQSAFTLGTNGGGIWKIEVFYPSFNMIDFVEGRLSLDIDGTVIPIAQRNFGSPGGTSGVIQSLYGNLTYNFSGDEVVKVQIRFDGAGGDGPFPGDTSPWTNRPPEITFTRVL